MKLSPGCNCCGGCAATKTFYDPGDWTAGVGGSVSDGTGSNAVDLDGPVDPSSFLSSEAWVLSFDVAAGSGVFTIDGVDYEFDSDLQTITADGTSLECGRAASAGTTMAVEIRVTPTHAYIFATGNYFGTYGVLTVARSSSTPSSFTAVWDTATISNFQIADASVTVTTDGTLYTAPVFSLRCWFRSDLEVCPYIVAKAATNSHQYFDSSNFQYYNNGAGYDPIDGDVDMSDVTLTTSGTVFLGLEDALIGSPFWSRKLSGGAIGDTREDSPSSDFDYRRGDSPCVQFMEIAQWVDRLGGTYNYYLTHLNIFSGGTRFSLASKTVTLEWGTPTVADAYPIPQFEAALSLTYEYSFFCFKPGPILAARANWSSGGSASATIAINDLSSGFVISVTGSGSYEWVGGVEPTDDDNCGAGWTPVGEPGAVVIGGAWTFAP